MISKIGIINKNRPIVINFHKDKFNLMNLNEFYMIIKRLAGIEKYNSSWASGYLLLSFAVSEFE